MAQRQARAVCCGAVGVREMEEIKKEVNTTAVKILEDLLQQAKSGEIQSIGIVGVLDDCRTFNVFDCPYHPVVILGEVRVLERDIIDCCVDTRRKPEWEYCE